MGTLFIDFRKAFDLDYHSIVFKNFLIINSKILLLIYLPLTFKTAYCLSMTCICILSNVTQIFYADDATVLTSGQTKSDVEAKLQHGGNKTKQWGKQNKMNMRYEKNILYVTRNETQDSAFSRIGHFY